MDDHLKEQLINELRALLQPINQKYKEFFHIQLITLCDMADMSCTECKDSEVKQQCMRCVIAFEEMKKQ
jgi:hypothetical protein